MHCDAHAMGVWIIRSNAKVATRKSHHQSESALSQNWHRTAKKQTCFLSRFQLFTTWRVEYVLRWFVMMIRQSQCRCAEQVRARENQKDVVDFECVSEGGVGTHLRYRCSTAISLLTWRIDFKVVFAIAATDKSVSPFCTCVGSMLTVPSMWTLGPLNIRAGKHAKFAVKQTVHARCQLLLPQSWTVYKQAPRKPNRT